jgi:hypothetical protein
MTAAAFLTNWSSPAMLGFWEWLEFVSIVIIVAGCAGEAWAAHYKFSDGLASPTPVHSLKEKWERRFGWMVVAFTFSFLASNHEIEGLRSDNLGLQTNVLTLKSNNLVMEKTVRELAHLYDQSTNALAEANERLKSIRPLKDRLIDCLNKLDPQIIPSLQLGTDTFSDDVPESKYIELQILSSEDGADKFITFRTSARTTVKQIWDANVEHGDVFRLLNITLKPALLTP